MKKQTALLLVELCNTLGKIALSLVDEVEHDADAATVEPLASTDTAPEKADKPRRKKAKVESVEPSPAPVPDPVPEPAPEPTPVPEPVDPLPDVIQKPPVAELSASAIASALSPDPLFYDPALDHRDVWAPQQVPGSPEDLRGLLSQMFGNTLVVMGENEGGRAITRALGRMRAAKLREVPDHGLLEVARALVYSVNEFRFHSRQVADRG